MKLEKVIPYEKAFSFFAKLKAEGKKIVQCHGTFDLVHPGHVYHFEEARDFGDVLVVTVTGEKFVNKGPGRPYFSDKHRIKFLAALNTVDYVVLIPFAAAVEAIECVQPDVYCKGTEYENPESDVTGNIHGDVAAVQAVGGVVRYIGSVVFSSTRLINNHFDHVPQAVKDICRLLAKDWPPDKFREAIESFRSLKVLVLGDIIIDRYSYVRVQGLTSKNRMLSGRYISQDSQAGGALAVFRHIKQFCDNVSIMSLTGSDPQSNAFIGRFIDQKCDFIQREISYQTVIKERFVEPLAEGKELLKLFSVNFIDADPPRSEVVDRLSERLSTCIQDFDMVVVADFGHGVMQEPIRRLVESKAKFMALNCQTNSNNHGFNIINHQYRRADCFSLDDQELLLSVAERHINRPLELEKLRKYLSSSSGWLTRGIVETLGITDQGEQFSILPLASAVTDTIGAGDAFYSVAALGAYKKLPIGLTTFMAQLAGAQAVAIVGNSTPISKEKLLKSGMALLNF